MSLWTTDNLLMEMSWTTSPSIYRNVSMTLFNFTESFTLNSFRLGNRKRTRRWTSCITSPINFNRSSAFTSTQIEDWLYWFTQDEESSDEVTITESRSMASGDGGTVTPGSVSLASLGGEKLSWNSLSQHRTQLLEVFWQLRNLTKFIKLFLLQRNAVMHFGFQSQTKTSLYHTKEKVYKSGM